MTYAEHYRGVGALARVLTDVHGVGKGVRVAIAMRNFPEWSVAFWAAASVGAVVVPLNAWWTGPELEYGLSDSGTCVLIADDERARRLVPHLKALALRGLIVSRVQGELPPGAVRLEDVLRSGPREMSLPAADIDPEDDATIFYTSGTTGKPKGALGTHRNICTNRASRSGISPASRRSGTAARLPRRSFWPTSAKCRVGEAQRTHHPICQRPRGLRSEP